MGTAWPWNAPWCTRPTSSASSASASGGKLGVCVGDLYREVQVNVVNRSRFIYPMLIGRMFMKKQLLVDPALRYTVAPKCAQAPKDG